MRSYLLSVHYTLWQNVCLSARLSICVVCNCCLPIFWITRDIVTKHRTPRHSALVRLAVHMTHSLQMQPSCYLGCCSFPTLFLFVWKSIKKKTPKKILFVVSLEKAEKKLYNNRSHNYTKSYSRFLFKSIAGWIKHNEMRDAVFHIKKLHTKKPSLVSRCSFLFNLIRSEIIKWETWSIHVFDKCARCISI